MDYKDFFERFLYEDSNDAPPDSDMGSSTGSPDIPDTASADDGPPDLDDMGGDELGSNEGGDMPPDMDGDDGFGDLGDDSDDEFSDDSEEGGTDLGLNEKISAIMNQQLYQNFLKLLSRISEQLTSIKKNSDVLYSLSSDSLDIIGALNKLEENLHMYIDNKFLNEDYSINRLFFDKCLNLWKLLNEKFDKQIRKGIKNIE